MAYAGGVIAGAEPFARSLRLLEGVQPGGVMSVDTETDGFSVRQGARATVVSMAWRSADGVGHSVAFPFGQGEGRHQIWAPPGTWELVLEKLAMSRLVMFHAHFDHPILEAGTRRAPGVDLGPNVEWCGMVGERAIIGGPTGGLKPTAERNNLLGGGERDGEEAIARYMVEHHLDKGDLHRVPWPVIQPYARIDAVLAYRLFEHHQVQLPLLSPEVRARVEAKMSALRAKLSNGNVQIDMAIDAA
jgi:hypothetical protein